MHDTSAPLVEVLDAARGCAVDQSKSVASKRRAP